MNPTTPGQTPFGVPPTPSPSPSPSQPLQPSGMPQSQVSPGAGPQPQVQPQPLQPFAQPPVVGSGASQGGSWKLVGIIAIVVALVFGGVAGWSYVNYLDQKNNTDSKISQAVAEGVKAQADKDAVDYQKKQDAQTRQFAGPDDYGHVTFEYPKEWSVYVNKDASAGGTYEAYLHPVAIQPITSSERYALRVVIETKDYDKVIDGYKSSVTKGSLQSSVFSLDSETSGTRLDGEFSKDIRGSAVIFKNRDKTVTLRTDAETFKANFDAIIKTITVNK